MRNIRFLAIIGFFMLVLSGCSQDSGSSRPTFNDPSNPSTGGGPNSCLAVDTDGDGLRDCEDPDIDNDGFLNAADKFPFDKNEWVDTDNDGYGDNGDWAANDSTEWRDFDLDEIGDNADPDDDNDGTPDRWDAFRTRSVEQFDIDFDTFGNDEDPDSDNDGYPDAFEDLFWRSGGFDIDQDLIPNESDPDMDNDNTVNEADAFPYNPLEWLDYDSDSIGNNADPDDDNDAVPDQWDAFPLNRNFVFDYDNDGFPNESDAFPDDATEWVDSDADGYGDNKDAFPQNPSEWFDTDGDGVGNNSDPDIDADGLLNQLPASEVLQVSCFSKLNEVTCLQENGCSWTTQNRCAPIRSCIAGGRNVTMNGLESIVSPSTCSSDPGCNWTGAICEQLDYFPLDKFETLDADLDGLGDNQDPDDDNDGFPDSWDDFKLRRDAFFDFDVDGIYDFQLPILAQDMATIPAGQYGWKVDPDSDNDGVPDFWDDLAWDPVEFYDIDHDGVGDNFDQDDDGDGTVDGQDAFPYNPLEWLDTDADSIGNNTDPDDDNDGSPDVWDTVPLNLYGFSDIDGDENPDQTDVDVDNDTFANGDLACPGSANNFICSFPDATDKFIFDNREYADAEPDGLGDNEDADDDNDGVPDIWDDLPLRNEGFADLNDNGIPNEVDTDIDGDGVENALDLYPYDKLESADTDSDTLGDNLDPDADNDGVPDSFDDFVLDRNYWADADLDGIPNETDIYTPFGINNEADLNTALAHNENISLTNSFSITSCKNLPANIIVYSPEIDNIQSLTFASPDNGCMFNLVGDKATVSATRLIMPENKQGTFITSNPNNKFAAIFQNDFKIYGKAKLLNLNISDGFIFGRNNVLFETKVNLGGTGYENLITLTNGTLAADSNVGFIFAGNIVMWKVTANQTAQVNFLKANNPVRVAIMQNNVLKLDKATGVNMVAGSSFFNFDYNGLAANPDKGIQATLNRVNMNFGQFLNMTSSNNSLTTEHNEAYVISNSNSLFGITDTGNPVINFNYNRDDAVCSGLEETPCGERSHCSWTGSSCISNGQYAKSYETYYDFKESDIFLAPNRGIYNMFYYPNNDKVASSPAMFPAEIYDIFYEVYIVQTSALGSYGEVYYIGVYAPVLDEDIDGFPNDEEFFPIDPNEWFDNDADGIGNNGDIDDDNDGMMDAAEKSYCAIEPSAFSCNVKAGCGFDVNSQSCRKVGMGCLVPGSVWDSTSKCCTLNSACVDGSDPFTADTDDDGLTDVQEMNTYLTNPLLADTDGDFDTDAEEVANNTNPLDPLSSKDSDGDGLNDNFEKNNFIALGCVNPHLTSDTDGDGITDFAEYNTYTTNPCLSDSDADGLTDFEEINTYMTDPKVSDSDDDGLTDGQEVLTYATNPNDSDSDNDGSNDGREVADGTNPNLSTSFKDTDGDLEADYVDKTPFGTVPCDNSNLALCLNTYTATELRDRFNLQITEAFNCGTKTSEVACNTNVFGLCKWSSGTSECKPKDIVVFNDLTLNNRCYSTVLAANNKTTNITVRSRPNTRKVLNIDNALSTVCSSNFSAGEGVFTLLANTGFTFKDIEFNVGNTIPTLITNTSSTNRGGFSLSTSKVSYISERSNGSNFIKLRDFSTVNIEQTTVRQVLLSNPTVNPLTAIEIKTMVPSVLVNLKLTVISLLVFVLGTDLVVWTEMLPLFL